MKIDGSSLPRLRYDKETGHLIRADSNIEKLDRAVDRAGRRVDKAEKRASRARRRAGYRVNTSQARQTQIAGYNISVTDEKIEPSDKKQKRKSAENVRKALNSASNADTGYERDDNAVLDAIEGTDSAAERIKQHRGSQARKRVNKAEKAEKKLDKANVKVLIRTEERNLGLKNNSSYSHTPQTGTINPSRVSNRSGMFRINDTSKSNSTSSKRQRLQRTQKRRIKKEYAKAKREGRQAFQATEHAVLSRISSLRDKKNVVKNFLKKMAFKAMLCAGALLLVIFAPSLIIGSMCAGGGVAASTVLSSSYPASDEDIYAAEDMYCAKEAELKAHFSQFSGKIGHDPYVLISMLSALNNGDPWTIEDEFILSTMDRMFDYQYQVSGNSLTCTKLSHAPIYMMNEEQLTLYASYMHTLGGNIELFPASEYVGKYFTNPPQPYTVDAEYLSNNPRFAQMMSEAEKYLGYPYVWGGYKPETSFDCSGFTSWVLNHSGWNVGRLSAQGLYNACIKINRLNIRPGDLIFFKGTYQASYPVTHVAIYVGHGMMIHAGDPIQYASFETPYYQSHLYAFGRLP